MTTEDDELCSSAVKRMPNRIARAGFESIESTRMNPSLSESGAMADLISPMPTNSMPNPSRIAPMCRGTGFFKNRYMIAPAKIRNGANAVRLNAVIWAVMVVPMFAPMMTPIACARFISPELTKPITIISVADELCTSIVTTIPIRTARTRLVVTFSRMVCSESPAAFLRPVDITVMPYKNRPTPPSSEMISQIVIQDSPVVINTFLPIIKFSSIIALLLPFCNR